MASFQEIWLLAKNISKTARKEINSMLKPLDLNSSEAGILMHLHSARKEMNQDQLGEMLDITKAAISRVAESLEKKQYITRVKGAPDKRYYWLSLTEKADQAMPRIGAIFGRIYETATAGLRPGELDMMIGLLFRVSGNLSRSTADYDQ